MSDLSNIVSKMRTQASTTLGWDVVINYGETELNNLLAAAYKADSTGNKAIKEFTCSVKVMDPDTGDYYLIDYIFNFGPPLITFIETDKGPMCSLTVPVMGGTANRNGDPPEKAQIIGANVYTITLNNLLLSAAKGGVTDDTVSSKNPTPYDNPFVFPADSEESGVVFIDFEASSKDLVVELTFTGPDTCKLNDPTPGCAGRAPRVDSQIGNLKDAIRNEILTTYKHVVYELARANNSKPSGAINLVPKSFMFGTFVPKGGETILSLFVQTGETNNGIQSLINSNWNVLWGTTLNCSPIPSGKSASVILAKNTIFASMIEPSLEKQGYSAELDNTIGSLQIQIDTKKEIHEPADQKLGTYVQITYHTAIDLVLPKLQLIFEQTPQEPAYCRGSWAYKYEFEWEEAYSGQGTHGTVTVENTLDEDTYPVKLEDEYSLEVSFKIRKEKWEVTATPDKQSFWDIINGGSTEVPSWTKDLNVFLPEMTIDMGSLDFFLTTNLLLPSRKVIDIDTSLGVQVPGDFYLVGSVENS